MEEMQLMVRLLYPLTTSRIYIFLLVQYSNLSAIWSNPLMCPEVANCSDIFYLLSS